MYLQPNRSELNIDAEDYHTCFGVLSADLLALPRLPPEAGVTEDADSTLFGGVSCSFTSAAASSSFSSSSTSSAAALPPLCDLAPRPPLPPLPPRDAAAPRPLPDFGDGASIFSSSFSSASSGSSSTSAFPLRPPKKR